MCGPRSAVGVPVCGALQPRAQGTGPCPKPAGGELRLLRVSSSSELSDSAGGAGMRGCGGSPTLGKASDLLHLIPKPSHPEQGSIPGNQDPVQGTQDAPPRCPQSLDARHTGSMPGAQPRAEKAMLARGVRGRHLGAGHRETEGGWVAVLAGPSGDCPLKHTWLLEVGGKFRGLRSLVHILQEAILP